MDAELARTARFYQIASDDLLDSFEDALDADDRTLAFAIRDEVLQGYLGEPNMSRRALSNPTYLSEEPEVGDMVFVNPSSRHARLIAVSNDRKMALVKEQFGCYTVAYADLRRVR